MESWILPILAGLSIGMVTFVVASGLSLTFGVMRIINFGHGAFFELALYFTIIVAGFFSNVNVSFWVALLLVPIIVAMIGGVTEVTLLHRTYFKDPLYQVLVTYGIAMIISEVVKIVWSSVVLAVPGPSLPIDTISIMGQKFPAYHLLVMVISGLIGLGLWFMLEKTSLGVLVRAVIND
ncbi:MAG: branched-chain amino acid ABC transporter permease, partial [Nitrospira sp.]|nr:branched-chain amino acid ABC transporter permease [Nitrospira sp.]